MDLVSHELKSGTIVKRNSTLINILVWFVFLSMLTYGCCKDDDNPTITYGNMTDQDGNIYKTVTIGKQVWMAENLKTTRYFNGTPIPLVETTTEWQALGPTGKAYCWYDNNIDNKDTYGALYTWAAAMNGASSSSSEPSDVQGVCPTGWHLPSMTEWRNLTNYLGGESVAGSKLKESGTSHWESPNEGATNSSGFTALPGGIRLHTGVFSSLAHNGFWWTSLEFSTTTAFEMIMAYGHVQETEGQKKIVPATDAIVIDVINSKMDGYSVRCVEGATTSNMPVITKTVTSITFSSANSGGVINSGLIDSVTARGICWSLSANPDILDNITSDGDGTGDFSSTITGLKSNSTYHLRAYAINSSGTYYGNEITFKTMTGRVTDVDGNEYYTVTIGNQIWMAKNLITTKFNDGTSIPLVSDSIAWRSLKSHGYCWYGNNLANKDIYGALYNGYSVKTGKLCPIGWHVPGDKEWSTLTNYLGKDSAGDKLKEAGNIHWIMPSQGTNESGFTALPGGFRTWESSFYFIGFGGAWWSSTSGELPNSINYWGITSNMHYIETSIKYMNDANSVRCLKN